MKLRITRNTRKRKTLEKYHSPPLLLMLCVQRFMGKTCSHAESMGDVHIEQSQTCTSALLNLQAMCGQFSFLLLKLLPFNALKQLYELQRNRK